MERERVNPPSLFKHPFYSRMVTVKGPCKFIFIAGMTAADTDYKWHRSGGLSGAIRQNPGRSDAPAYRSWRHMGRCGVSSHLCGRCRRISQIAG
jgi:hypothetical protein